MRHLVVDSRLVTYEYFMDYIQEWEIRMLIPIAIQSHRTEWETARYIAYHNAIMSGNLKKQYAQKPMTELFPLPYDELYHNYKNPLDEQMRRDITNDEVNILRQRASKLGKKLMKRKTDIKK